MNKLQEIRKKFVILLEYNYILPKEVKEVLADFVIDSCIEYARSKVPTDGENPYFANDIEYKHLLEVFNIINNSIQQDLQSLNN